MSQIHSGGNNSSGLPGIDTLTGNTGGAVGPDVNNNINVVGTGSVTVTGTPLNNTLTISVTGGGFSWSSQSGAFSAIAQNGYMMDSNAAATLPASPTLGNTIVFVNAGGLPVTVTASGGKTISLGMNTTAANGTLTSSENNDSMTLVYDSGTGSWIAISGIGTWN